VIDGRCAAYHGSGGNVVRNAALGYGYGSVSDFYVAAYAYLSGEDYVVAYFGGSGEAYLSAKQRVVPYGAAVAYMDHVVQLCASSYAGLAYAGAVDAGVGLEFGIALDYYHAGLDNFVPAAGIFVIFVVMLGEAEAVAAYDHSVLQQNVVSQLAEFSYYGVGVGEEIIACGYSAIDDNVRQEDCVVSDHYVFVDYRIGTDVRILA
jgi:hypothetical protein